MIPFNKIVITGPVGAGKTTAIKNLSDIAPISTEQIATDETRNNKNLTTVAMDYGSIKLSTGETIHLYGTPGQKRFNFTWDVLTDGCIGIVILLDHSAPSPLEDLRFYLDTFKDCITRNAAVIGITHWHNSQGLLMSDYYNVLDDFGINPAVFEVDPRNINDLIILIQALLFTLYPSLACTYSEA